MQTFYKGQLTRKAYREVQAFIQGKTYDSEVLEKVTKRLNVPMTAECIRYGLWVYMHVWMNAH